MRDKIRVVVKMLALPIGVGAILCGYLELSHWLIVGVSAIAAIGFADQRLGSNNPLDPIHIFPGKLRHDLFAGAFGFVGVLAGLSVMYLIGRVFA